jgi:hypothetical protein
MMEQINVFDLLSASDPLAEYADKLMLFGQFVGSWDMDGTWYDRSGGRRKGKGEWHFAWILGGRGIQDVLFASGALPHQRGTSLRCYDIAKDVWHVVWMQPASSEFVHLTGQKVGERIALEGVDFGQGPLRRWSFIDITPNSFTWLGEVLNEDGVTWFLEQEMRGVRRTNPGNLPASEV